MTKPPHAETPGITAPWMRGVHEWSGHSKGGQKWQIHRGDAAGVLKTLEENRFQAAVTSPPYYWQRDYEVDGQLGLERTIDSYVDNLVSTMREVKRVLRKDGLLFLNLGDTYYSAKGQPTGDDKKNKARRFGLRAVDASGLGVPRKTIIGIPWRVALAMVADGWILRSPIVWQRTNSLPEPTSKDRPWRTYEFIFMFAKSQRYFFDRGALGGEEDIWRISARSNPSRGLHSAAYPIGLVDRCLECSTKPGDEVLDPFAGTATTLVSALELGRACVGIDLKREYCEYAVKRLEGI